MRLLLGLVDGLCLGFVLYATARPHHAAQLLGLVDRQSEQEGGEE